MLVAIVTGHGRPALGDDLSLPLPRFSGFGVQHRGMWGDACYGKKEH